jgi:hypothetical protein
MLTNRRRRGPLIFNITLIRRGRIIHHKKDGARTQSKELTRGTTELVQHFCFIGGDHIGARSLLDINSIWFGNIARLSCGEEECILLVQMISTWPSLR